MGTELSITYDDLKRFTPCYTDYAGIQLEEYARRRERWTWREIAAADEFPIVDRMWLLLRPQLIPEEVLHLLGCEFVEYALLDESKAGREPSKEFWAALSRKRAWIVGLVSDQDMESVMFGVSSAIEPLWCDQTPFWAAKYAVRWTVGLSARTAAWHSVVWSAAYRPEGWQKVFDIFVDKMKVWSSKGMLE